MKREFSNVAAFPLHIPTAGRGDVSETNEGMTLRDYFAARAPAEIPSWFTHAAPDQSFPPMPDYTELDEEQASDTTQLHGEGA